MCSYALCCLLQIEVKLKKRDGLRWAALERDPTTSKIMQFMPEGRSQWELQNGTCCWGLCHWKSSHHSPSLQLGSDILASYL